MALYAKNATRQWTTETILNAAVGMEDPYGNPFRIVHLDWNPARKNSQYAKTVGFEDAIIHKLQSGLKIEYRKPGYARWMQNKLTRRFYSQVADTPHNRKMIAAGISDKFWTVRERDVSAACEQEAENLWKSMTKEERAFHKKRIKGSWRYRYDDDENNAVPDSMVNAKAENENIVMRKADLFKEREKLDKQKAELEAERQKLDDLISQAAANGIQIVQYKPEVLRVMKMAELRKICNEKNIPQELTMKKADLIEAIIARQHGKESLKMERLKEKAEDAGSENDGEITE